MASVAGPAAIGGIKQCPTYASAMWQAFLDEEIESLARYERGASELRRLFEVQKQRYWPRAAGVK